MAHPHRKYTLAKKLALLILAAAIVSGIVFLTLQKITNDLIDGYLSSDEYYEQESAKYIQKFSRYVSENELSSTDRKAFGEWVKKENYINLTIFNDQVLQYDSIYSAADESAYGKERMTQYAKHHSYPVQFSDGKGRVMVDGFYSSRYHDLAFTLELLGATLIFLLIVLLGIRKSLRYLQTIHQEIHILEGGELDYEMTVKGHDELAMIAKSIEDLRKAFLDKLQAIDVLQEESRSLVTEMSHDMRTPLTSLMMNLEFAKKEETGANTRKDQYIASAYGKALQLKNLSDNLFAYFLLDKEHESELETVAVKEVIYDLLSDQVAILHQENFKVHLLGELPDSYINVNVELLGRVFDNVMSNLRKYADPKKDINLTFLSDQEIFEIHISNAINETNDTQESTGLGERSIKRMMSRMNGQFESIERNDVYYIVLRFWNIKM
ncbi:HAMP domain-containing sensor histidine kinase [Bacillus safensis]|uniref:HAMP domain-containing sensor histidine kinase n=1 Tax=Bacillus safensis TaxID=561879 RepID=UPI0007DC1E46|nr:HAMP domain-containing sensor histidine kinase [Bacillus safensis]MBW4854535.1 HAMP domain-containing histidine kinase [Bacillaceae bacterium]MBW4857432.1 HAMP domain-containing histidine kinase [Bacillaceae bacterium]PRS22862.1 sensor histidine kinase [Bacillus safensis]